MQRALLFVASLVFVLRCHGAGNPDLSPEIAQQMVSSVRFGSEAPGFRVAGILQEKVNGQTVVDLKISGLPVPGQVAHFQGNGQAFFKQYTDGRWILERMTAECPKCEFTMEVIYDPRKAPASASPAPPADATLEDKHFRLSLPKGWRKLEQAGTVAAAAAADSRRMLFIISGGTTLVAAGKAAEATEAAFLKMTADAGQRGLTVDRRETLRVDGIDCPRLLAHDAESKCTICTLTSPTSGQTYLLWTKALVPAEADDADLRELVGSFRLAEKSK